MTLASFAGILTFFFGSGTVTGLLYSHEKFRSLFLWLMVFTTCYVKKPFYQEVFFMDYRGVDRGFGVTLPDLFLTGFFLFFLTGGAKRKISWLPFNSIPWFLLILVSFLSLFGSLEPLLGLFTIHKFIRCWVLYVVVINLVQTREDLNLILNALATAVVFEGLIVVFDKYITRSVVVRSIGTFRHPNTLAMYIDLILPALLGLIMTSSITSKQRFWFSSAILAGFISVLFTKSRAAMIILPSGLAMVGVISVLSRPTLRKNLTLLFGLLVAIIVGAMALPRLIARFENAPKESAETRVFFNDAAKAMARDNWFGVGLNQYSNALDKTDYYWFVYADKLDEPDPDGFRETVQGKSRLGTAHHIYWLYASETGYFGLAFFLLHCALFWFFNLSAFFKEKDEFFKSIYLGLLVSTTMHHLHGFLEWIFRQTEVQFLFFILMGMMVAMAQIRKNEAAG